LTIIFSHLSHPEVILCKLPKLMLDDAQVLSKWGAQTVDANPDMAKARRRVKSLDPQWRFCFSTAVEFDPATDSVIVADSQRNRLQIYKKVRDDERRRRRTR
jgi:hypothetical protein